MESYTSFDAMAAGTGQNTQGAMSVFNEPSGWVPALRRDLPPSEMGYQFEASPQPNGRIEIVGWEVSPQQGEGKQAFYVSDAMSDDPTNTAKAKQVVEALNTKYRAKPVRERRLE